MTEPIRIYEPNPKMLEYDPEMTKLKEAPDKIHSVPKATDEKFRQDNGMTSIGSRSDNKIFLTPGSCAVVGGLEICSMDKPNQTPSGLAPGFERPAVPGTNPSDRQHQPLVDGSHTESKYSGTKPEAQDFLPIPPSGGSQQTHATDGQLDALKPPAGTHLGGLDAIRKANREHPTHYPDWMKKLTTNEKIDWNAIEDAFKKNPFPRTCPPPIIYS
jgi:hypothetical protein